MNPSQKVASFLPYLLYEDRFPQLTNHRLSQLKPRLVGSLPNEHKKFVDSNVWVRVGWGNGIAQLSDEVLAPSYTPRIRPGEAHHSFSLFHPCRARFYNKDQFMNDFPSLTPVTAPHNIDLTVPFVGQVATQLLMEKQSRSFSSHWWINASGARRKGLMLKPHQRAVEFLRVTKGCFVHVSQLLNPESIQTLPTLALGISFPESTLDMLQRYVVESNFSTGLFFRTRHLELIGSKIRNGAQPFTMIYTSPYSSPHSEPEIVHYYNIGDVKLPSSFLPNPIVSQSLAQQPHVPINGVTGSPLMHEALMGRANIVYNAWFSAQQLISIGGRCGANATPVAVSQPVSNDHQYDLVNCDLLEDPKRGFLSYLNPELVSGCTPPKK